MLLTRSEVSYECTETTSSDAHFIAHAPVLICRLVPPPDETRMGEPAGSAFLIVAARSQTQLKSALVAPGT